MEATFSWFGMGILLLTASFLTITEAQLNLQDPLVLQILAILRLHLHKGNTGQGTSSHGGGHVISNVGATTPHSYNSYHPTPDPDPFSTHSQANPGYERGSETIGGGVEREVAGQEMPRHRSAHVHANTITSSTGQQGRPSRAQPDPCPQYLIDLECHCLPECTYMMGFEETSSCGATAEFVMCCPSHLAGRCW